MSIKRKKSDSHTGASSAWPLVLAAAAVFCLLAALPVLLPLVDLQLAPSAAKTSHGVTLLPAPSAPAPVAVPAVAQPVDADGQAASLPTVNGTREAAAVAAEDSRIRIMLHDAAHTYEPEVIPTRGSLPTLVLTAGQGTYTAADLVQYGALVMLPHNAALLLDNIFVSTNAHLDLGGPNLRTIYLDNGSGGFATIVAWGGNLSFYGSAGQPMTIMGWNRTLNAPAQDSGSGRSYIREVGGKMTLSDVRVSSLGFWSGRTGGVAWTGLTGAASTGDATNSTFTDDTYGSFVSRGSGVTFRDDLFEFNELDGLHIHRYSVNSTVSASSAARNGGNGFVVSPATQNTKLKDDLSEHNAGNGYFINGKPIATGASASGGSVAPGSGTVVADSAALNNGEIGILVEGGTGTVIEGDQVCASVTAVAVRYDVTQAVLTGNDIRCAPRSGFSIGPATPGLMLSGNTVVSPRTGVLISNSGPIELDSNHIAGATVFGVSARGTSSKVTGVGNVISGTGFRAIDARADASMPALSESNVSDWAYHGRVSFWSYLRFHPLAALWLGIVILVLLAWVWSHRRKLPRHPYPASTNWRGDAPATPAAEPAPRPVPVRAAAAPVPARAPAPVGVPAFAGAHAATSSPSPRVAATVPIPIVTGYEHGDGVLTSSRGHRRTDPTRPGAGPWRSGAAHGQEEAGRHELANAGPPQAGPPQAGPPQAGWPQEKSYPAAGSRRRAETALQEPGGYGRSTPSTGNDRYDDDATRIDLYRDEPTRVDRYGSDSTRTDLARNDQARIGTNGYGTDGTGTNGYGANGHGANGHGANGHGANGHGANGHGANGSGTADPGTERPPWAVTEPPGSGLGASDSQFDLFSRPSRKVDDQ
jgi:hypothetical protein